MILPALRVIAWCYYAEPSGYGRLILDKTKTPTSRRQPLRRWRRDDCGRSPGHDCTGHSAGAADDIPHAIGGRDGVHGCLDGRVDGVEIVHELGGFDRD